jgi:ABC-2 type transport system permease protein
MGRSMHPAPGSAVWLLAHELRLAWYGAAVNARGRRRPGVFALGAWTVGWIALHLFAWAVLHEIGPDGMASPLLTVVATLLLYAGATFMLSTALKASVTALFERGDLDLLLSSPLPSRSIFAVRLLGVAGSTAGLWLYLLGPVANVALVMGYPAWLGIYVALGATALLAACAGMLATLGLVRVLGARRTRALAQVLAAIAGALLFLIAQLGNLLPGHGAGMGTAVQRLLAESSQGSTGLVWLPGRAAMGQPAALLAMGLLAAGALVLTVLRTHRFFVHGLQQTAAIGRAPAAPARVPARVFRDGLFESVLAKEWRLVARDPQLLSQVLLQLVYLLPMLFMVMRSDAGPAPALAAGLTVLASALTGNLAWIVISGEEAPDLLRASPAPARTIRLAKLAAATMPVLLLVAAPLLWMVAHGPVTGLLTAFTTVFAILGAGVVVLWSGRPAARSDFKLRGKENIVCSLLEGASGFAWAGLAWSLVRLAHGSADGGELVLAGAAGALAVALSMPVLAWCARQRPM